ncbi:MAG: acetate--CoA ligase [Desulforhopalus sp.]|jgi:acetyl-CoA synthetase|nr:acetate--CoA ligase [Desulforhopalus sp.]
MDPNAGARRDFEQFWAQRADELLQWSRPWKEVCSGDFRSGSVAWFRGGQLNASVNCLDRHLSGGRRNKAALIWQGENDREVRAYTYQMLFSEVCRFANVLKKKGVKKGDCVGIYLPMVPELVVAVLACARIGAVHVVVFSGFSSVSLRDRLDQCQAKILITTDFATRAGRIIPLKPNADEAMDDCAAIEKCIVVRRQDRDINMELGRDSWYHLELAAADISACCPAETLDATDPLFVLYTAGVTGPPKPVTHGIGGYLVHALYSCREVFAPGDDDIFWCTADIGWITGHSYSIYGPLGLGGTVLQVEGVPLYPEPSRFWQIIEKFRVSILYTAPTVIRVLMRYGEGGGPAADLSSLRLLASVGETVNPGAWEWFKKLGAGEEVSLVDTWCQTETGGILLAPRAGCAREKPGSVAKPLPGIDIAVLDSTGGEADPDAPGHLVVRSPWPGMPLSFARSGATRPGDGIYSAAGYDTGDIVRRDGDGDLWIMGRLADIIQVGGHRLGTAEIEAALLAHPSVAEAAVVGIPDDEKGEAVYAYVTPQRNVAPTWRLLEDLRQHLARAIGPLASPEIIQFAAALPKTRSGKIIRHLLKKIAAGDMDAIGDLSALADPSVVTELIEGKKTASSKAG